ncbi:MAG TPA: hypothetical protein VGT40_15830 [Methylomirabilota bacterium]|jgi:hypothetical protein|nr:hypothetical protein [Methylomirabilota bacterium]
MPLPPERRWPLVLAGYALFLILVGTASAPIYYLVEVPHRPLVVRLAAALILAVVAIHLSKKVRAGLEDQSPSAFELALEPGRPQPTLDQQFVRVRDDLHYSAQDGRYFDQVVWPELAAVADRSRRAIGREPLAKPPGRFFRRGPSVMALRNLIATIEEAGR